MPDPMMKDVAKPHGFVDCEHGSVRLGVAGIQAVHVGPVRSQPRPHVGLNPTSDATVAVRF